MGKWHDGGRNRVGLGADQITSLGKDERLGLRGDGGGSGGGGGEKHEGQRERNSVLHVDGEWDEIGVKADSGRENKWRFRRCGRRENFSLSKNSQLPPANVRE